MELEGEIIIHSDEYNLNLNKFHGNMHYLRSITKTPCRTNKAISQFVRLESNIPYLQVGMRTDELG